MRTTSLSRRNFLGTLGMALNAHVLAQALDKPPLNFVFIMADDLGWADLGCYGSTYHETPNIDALARQGMRFTDAYAACPVCSPTRESILTGKYPARTRLTNFLVGRRWPKESPLEPLQNWSLAIKREERTLPELMKAADYITGHVGKWHLGKDERPEDHGFDVNIAGGEWGTPPSYISPYKNRFVTDGPAGEYLTDRLGVEAERFIAQNSRRAFFLQIWHYGVHLPLVGPHELVQKYQKKSRPVGRASDPTYAAMLESMDHSVGRVMRKLEELNIADRTAIIFTSDNGGLAMPEWKVQPTSNAPLREGKGFLYEGGIRVPWIVKWPGVTKAGAVSGEVVTSVDFFPTIAEAVGRDSPPGIDGISFRPALQGRTMSRDAIFWHYPHYANQGGKPGGAVRAGDWKLIEWYEDGRLELYNLKDDPSESSDRLTVEHERAAALQEQLRSWRAEVGAQMPRRKQ